MNRLPIFLILIFAMTANAAFAGAIAITSTFEPSTAEAGDYTTFVVTVNGDSGSNMTGNVPKVQGLLVVDNPSVSNQVRIVNGSITSFTRFTYNCRASKEGNYTIPAYNVTIDGKSYTVPSATLSIVKSGEENNNALLVEIEAPDTLYVGQSAQATVHFLIRSDLNPIQGSLAPQRSGDGIAQEPFDNTLITTPTVARAGTHYQSVTIPAVITALNAGKQTYAYDVDLQIRMQSRSRADSADDFDDPMERMMRNMQHGMLDEMTTKTKALHARGEAIIDVKTLPPNPPASFGGTIGNYSISGTLSAHKTKVGEPVELNVEIIADGSLKQLAAPKPDESDAWRVYPPTEELKQDDRFGLKGTKKFKYLLSPLKSGDLATPALRFSYLDPTTGQYVEKAIQGEAVAVEAVPGMNVPRSTPSTQTSQPQTLESPIQNDDGLSPISLLDTSASSSALLPPQKQIIFLCLQILPTLLMIFAIAVPIVRRNAMRDPLAKARKGFSRAAARANAKALQAVKRKDTATFFAETRVCLQNAVCARDPSRRTETVSATDVIAALGEDGQTLRREINLLYNGGDAMRYGGESVSPDDLLEPLGKIVSKLEVK
jgi:hypothetical protein